MASVSLSTSPVILPDFFTLCTALSKATAWIDLGFTDHIQTNNIIDDDSKSQSASTTDEESSSDEDEEDQEDENDEDTDIPHTQDHSNHDSQSEVHEDEHEPLLNDMDEDHMHIPHSISTLLRHQQMDLDHLFSEFEHLLRLRSRAEALEEPELETDDSWSTTEYTWTESTSELTELQTSHIDRRALPIESKQDLLFLIASFTYRANETYIQNYFNVLKFYVVRYYGFQHLYIDDILSIIVSYIESTLRFCAASDVKYYNQKLEQVTFENQQSIVRFNHAENDYLNIISESCVLDSNDMKEGEDNPMHILIHCLILDKGDEGWVGFIDKNAFSIHRAVERRKGSLLYYGGREELIPQKETQEYSVWDNGFGAIHQAGHVQSEKLPSYSKGDWISFLIQKKEDHWLSIFKNGQLIYRTDTWPFKMDPNNEDSINELYFMCTVDHEVDAIFVEQAMYNGQIPFGSSN